MNYPDRSQLSKDVNALKSNSFKIDVTLSPFDIWILICQLEISLTHPIVKGEIAEKTREIVENFKSSHDWAPSIKQSFDWASDPNSCSMPEYIEEHLNRIQQRNNN